jgi:hypothetical protein
LVTVTGAGLTPNLHEEQGVRAQEKAKKPGYGGSSSTGVSDSGPDPSESDPDLNPDRVASQPKRPLEVEIVQVRELPPEKARPSTGKGYHTSTSQRHSLPEQRPPGQQRRIGGSDRVTSRAGAPTSSRQSRPGGKNGTPAASVLSSPSAVSSSRPARVRGARSSSSRMAQNEPSWSRGVEAT